MAQPKQSGSTGHLGALDGLRGSMALWVLVGHVFGNTGLHWVPILASPHYAVDGFMLLSGFLMTWHYVRREGKEPWTSWRTWGSFYVRRYFRISPLYYLLLIPSFLFLSAYSAWQVADSRILDLAHTLVVPVSAENVAVHVSYIFGVLPRYCASLPLPDWSISLEMQFYLLFPFLMLFVLRFGWLALGAVAGAVWYVAHIPALGLTTAFSQPSPLCLSIVWFAVGMIWAGDYARQGKPRRVWIITGLALALLTRDLHDIILVAVFAWILFADTPLLLGGVAGACRRALSSRLSTTMADASYSVYLTHLLILRAVAHYLLNYTKLSHNAVGLITLPAVIVASYCSAFLLRPIEQWGISVGRSLSRKVMEGQRKLDAAVELAVPKPEETLA